MTMFRRKKEGERRDEKFEYSWRLGIGHFQELSIKEVKSGWKPDGARADLFSYWSPGEFVSIADK
jgi:hypothetical protein